MKTQIRFLRLRILWNDFLDMSFIQIMVLLFVIIVLLATMFLGSSEYDASAERPDFFDKNNKYNNHK